MPARANAEPDLVRLHAQLRGLDRQIGVARREPAGNGQRARVAQEQDPSHVRQRRVDHRREERRAASVGDDVVELVEHHGGVKAAEVLANPVQRGRFTVGLLQAEQRGLERPRERGIRGAERHREAAQQLAQRRMLRTRGEPHVRRRAQREIVAQQRALAQAFVRDDERHGRAACGVQPRVEPLARERSRLRVGDQPVLARPRRGTVHALEGAEPVGAAQRCARGVRDGVETGRVRVELRRADRGRAVVVRCRVEPGDERRARARPA